MLLKGQDIKWLPHFLEGGFVKSSYEHCFAQELCASVNDDHFV